jgi:hypothetical protein
MANSWFNYNDSGIICNPTSYAAVAVPNCPSPKQRLCAIFAEVQIIGGIQRPIITSALCTEINLAVSTLIESANVKLKP